MIKRFKSASIYEGTDLDSVYLDQANVKTVMSVLSEDQWNYLFPVANKIYDYDSFLKAVAQFPMFCGEDYGRPALCQRELATFFAHTAREVGKETPNDKYPEWRQSFYFVTESACTPANGKSKCNYTSTGWSATVWPPVKGQQYFGRGPLQLSWDYNYAQLSTTIFDDENVLLKNPSLIESSGQYAFTSALWFYMTPQTPKPSMHEVATNLYKPNAYDKKAGLDSTFGTTIMIINGGYECTTANKKENSGAQKR